MSGPQYQKPSNHMSQVMKLKKSENSFKLDYKETIEQSLDGLQG